MLSWKPPSPFTQMVRLWPEARQVPIEPGRPVPIAPREGELTTRWPSFKRKHCKKTSLHAPELPGARTSSDVQRSERTSISTYKFTNSESCRQYSGRMTGYFLAQSCVLPTHALAS